MADRQRGARRLSLLLALAALLVAIAPLLGRPLGEWLVPADLRLDAALPALVRGSLVATLVLFGLPVLLLGAVTPMLVVLLAGTGRGLGRAVGTVSALATAGSLIGTFAATHLLVPWFGCRATLWSCAAVLALCSLLVRKAPAGAAAVVLALGSLLLQGGPLRLPAPGQELLAEQESRYQYLQVTRQDGVTQLQINEGLDSFHSVAVAGSALTGGRYYDFHAAAPWVCGDGQRPPDLRVLSVGEAAGTFGRLYQAVHPGVQFDAVELDPAAVALGERWFGGRTAMGSTWAGLDGRVAIAHAPSHYHVILLDAYAHQVYIPAHLASREFFAEVADCLADGGVVSVNVGGLHFGDPVVRALAETMAHVFGGSAAFRVPASRNFVLMARKARALAPEVLARVRELPALSEVDRKSLAEVLARMAEPAAWHRYGAEGSPLVDDRPELDLLLHRSYVAAPAHWGPVLAAGTRPVVETEALAHAALQAQDLDAVLAAVASSREPSAYLRLLCGDARWHLRDLRGAAAEYGAAEALAPAPELQQALSQRIRDLAAETSALDAAEATAARNGWLAAAAAMAALLLAALLVARA
jgi:spermidine synthase